MPRLANLLWLAGVAALWAGPAGLRGEDNFRMFTQPVRIPERGEVISYVLVAGTNRFSFLPPPGWNVSEDAAKRTVTCVPQDFGAKISFSLIPGSTRTLEQLRTDDYRKEVADRFDEARLTAEFVCRTGAAAGVAFDVERLSPSRPPVTTRLAFIPLQDLMVEFNLTSETRRFDRYDRVLGNLLTSFRRVADAPRK